MIKLNHINKYFDYNKENENHVLKDVSFKLPKKGIVSIVGESGSGKTTLLKILAKKLKYEKGNIEYLVNDLLLNSQKNVGYIYQDFALLNQLSVIENMKLQLQAVCINDDSINNILIKMGIENLKYRVVESLSGGEKQKVAIARALLIDPLFIVADEPTGNLDPDSTILVMSLLSDIAKKKLVVIVTHDSKISNKYSNIIYNLEDGYLNLYKENKHLPKTQLLNENFDKCNTENSNSKLKKVNIFRNILHFDKVLICLFIIVGISLSLLVGVLLEMNNANPIDFASMPKDYYYVDGTLNVSNSEQISYNDLSDLKTNNIIESYYVLRNIRESGQDWGILFETGSNFSQITNKEIVLPFNLVEYSNKVDYGLLYGRLPNSNNEIVVDSLIANYIFKETEMGFFMTNYRDIANSTIVLRGQNEIDNYTLDIVGVVDSGVPCIYSSKDATVSFDGYSFNMHSYYLYDENIKIDFGRYPLNPYEILYPYNAEYLGENNEFVSFSINNLNGFEYTVVGLYSDVDNTKSHTIALTTNETLELSYLNILMSDFSVQLISEKQKDLFENETNLTVTNIYDLEKEIYVNENISKIKLFIYTILFSIIIIFFITLLISQNRFKSIINDIRVMRILGFSKFRIIYDFYIKHNLCYFVILLFIYTLFTVFCISVNMLLNDIISFYNFNFFIFIMTIILFWIIETVLFSVVSMIQLRKV